MRVRSLVFVSLLMLLLAAPAAGRADEPALDRAWSVPTPLDPGAGTGGLAIAGFMPGRTMVVRLERPESTNLIVASLRDAVTGLESAQTLDTGYVVEPAADASFAGGAVAAWVNAEDGTVRVAERPAGATAFAPAFSAPECCGDYSGDHPKVAVGRRGDAVVAWLARDGDDQQHVMASYRPVGGDFGAPEDAGATTAALLRDVALGADGTIALGWDEGGQATVAVRDPAGNWAAPEVLGAPDGERGWSSPALGVDGEGRVAAAWRETAPGADVGTVKLAYRDAGGPFGVPHDTGLTTMGSGSSLQLAVSDAGEVILVSEVEHALSGGGGGMDGIWGLFGTTVRGDVGPPARLTEMWGGIPSLAMSPRGDAVLTWDACCPMVLGARRRLPGGSFGAAVDVTSPITFTGARGGRTIRQAGIDEAGNAAAAWIDFELGQLFVGSDGPVIPTVPAPVTSVPAALPAVTTDPEPEPEPVGPVGGSLPAPVPPVVPAPAPAPPAPVPPPGPGVLKPVPAPLALRARARVVGASAHRRAEVRIHCSSACAARVTATLGKKVRLRAVGVMLRRRGEARVTVALPARRRGAHRRAWLAVAVTATGTDGSHARSSARVRVRV